MARAEACPPSDGPSHDGDQDILVEAEADALSVSAPDPAALKLAGIVEAALCQFFYPQRAGGLPARNPHAHDALEQGDAAEPAHPAPPLPHPLARRVTIAVVGALAGVALAVAAAASAVVDAERRMDCYDHAVPCLAAGLRARGEHAAMGVCAGEHLLRFRPMGQGGKRM